ncbi:anthrax toxin lethal factor-related metalloendopeptidase [Cytobacillus sp. NCCP-133]|uniref:anthrax toxin lethal factor-related metalloendopeptidase n=1 Tax=Cytobacillus sp. NCCP-133 TaxID=766848 RepID=UPI002231D7B8|nr:toxin [Cytobacillus sp. NCCP-133]GLB57873.1 Pro-Pro endopeptidase [Cytobacillus sp. NCCP-133]
MLKMVLTFTIMIVSLALLGNSQAAIGGIKLKDYPQSSQLMRFLILNSPNELGDIFILPIEPFDEGEASNMISRIDNLPGSLLTKIEDEDIKVKLFVGKLTDNPTAQHLEGVIPRGYTGDTTWDDVPGIGGAKTVLVKIGFSEKGKGHGSVNLELHELAHSVDRHVYNGIRLNQKFLTAWKAEKAKLFPGQSYFLTFPEEYFAEAFAMYFVGGEPRKLLRLKAPETYEFIKKLK